MRTRRLNIEPLVESHARKLFHALQDLRLYRFYAGRPPATIDELERRYAGWAKRISPDGSQIWLNYALRRDDGAYVGWIQATIAGEVATIGYDVFPNFWRQGYGSEACEQLVRALCASASVRRVVASVSLGREQEPAVQISKTAHNSPIADRNGRTTTISLSSARGQTNDPALPYFNLGRQTPSGNARIGNRAEERLQLRMAGKRRPAGRVRPNRRPFFIAWPNVPGGGEWPARGRRCRRVPETTRSTQWSPRRSDRSDAWRQRP